MVKPVLVIIDAKRMHAAGFVFARSPNDVWLTDHVPPQYLSFGGGSDDEENSRGTPTAAVSRTKSKTIRERIHTQCRRCSCSR